MDRTSVNNMSNTPVVTKAQTEIQNAQDVEEVSVDLTDKKLQDLTQLDIVDPQEGKLFNKTTTNDFIAMSNGIKNFSQMEGQVMVSNLIDSQTSSPQNESVVEPLSFGNTKSPITASVSQNRSQTNQQTQQCQRNISSTNTQQEVLASSGPQNSNTSNVHHVKSQSTSANNYLSNVQQDRSNATSGTKASQQAQENQGHQQNQIFAANSNSQGRATVTRKQGGINSLQEGLHGVHPLDNHTGTKSAVLNPYQSKQDSREIRKIPSKKNVTGKKKRFHRHDQTGNPTDNPFTSETDMSSQQQTKMSVSSAKHKQRHSSHNANRIGGVPGQNSEGLHQTSTPGTSVMQATPIYQPPPMPTGDQYQGFSFITPIGQTPFSFQGLTAQQQQQLLSAPQMGFAIATAQQQPQVHFIAKQQKFYGISPERGGAPIVFKQNSSTDKRPYTSSGNMLNKRVSKQQSAQNSNNNKAIAALYLGSKTHQNGFNIAQPIQPRNQSQPVVDDHMQRYSQLVHSNPTSSAYSMQQIPHRSTGFSGTNSKQKGNANQSNSAHVYRREKGQVGSGVSNNLLLPNGKLPEQLQEEVLKLKQTANTHKEENIKLKTKIKILENEMGRKERTIEDFLQQHAFIQNAQKNSSNSSTLAPIVQTAARYQAETFLVMSLKKQVKEQKSELVKKEEELALSKRNIKNTKFFEMDQELKLYRDELIRLRYILEQTCQQNIDNISDGVQTTGRPSATEYANQQNVVLMSQQTQNYSQPSILGSTGVTSGANLKLQSNSQTNFFQADATSNLSIMQQMGGTAGATSQDTRKNHMTLSNDGDQITEDVIDLPQHNNTFPPLKAYASNGNNTPGPQLSVIDTNSKDISANSNEILKKLSMQLAEKDTIIKQFQQQLDEANAAKQRIQRTPNNESKGGSAGPSTKNELQKVKKQLREKEKEILKLKSDQSQLNRKNLVDEESEKRVKQLSNQLSQLQKKAQESKVEIQKRDDANEKLRLDLVMSTETHKKQTEKDKKETSQAHGKLQDQVDKLNKQTEEKTNENQKLKQDIITQQKQIQDLQQQLNQKKDTDDSAAQSQKKAKLDDKTVPEEEKTSAFEKSKTDQEKKNNEIGFRMELTGKVEGELGLIATVLGCRENRDRIEFASDLREFIAREEKKEKGEQLQLTHLGLASDYQLKLSSELIEFVKEAEPAMLALTMPKYEFISPSLALIIMNEVRRMLVDPELIDILNEKDQETKLPFDALRDLCARFDKVLNDEHCAFITASYLTGIDEATIYINFKEFLADVKDPRSKEIDITSSRIKNTSSIGSEGSDSDLRRLTRGRDNSPLSDILQRSAGKGALNRIRRSVDDEHMLDVAEAIFVKLADLMNEKGRGVRSFFNKYAEPEMLPDRTVLELLGPRGFLAGVKDVGIEDLQEFEVACLMRVLAKPELDSCVILNEFVMIMENFGVADQEDDCDDYIPDTEQSVHSNIGLEGEESKLANDADKIKDNAIKVEDIGSKSECKNTTEKKKRLARQHNLENIDAKGIKILRKLARFLLKHFLHPREFFGRAIIKQQIKTKKREFYLDTMTFKEFYLRIKIANIRKRLTSNESLNKEICLDSKTHTEIINVKIMVKALEEIAEEEQKVLLQEEKEAAEKLAAKKAEEKEGRETVGTSDVETPRSESGSKSINGEEEKKEKEEEGAAKPKKEQAKEMYGIDSMKFGNSLIRGKGNNTTHSPLLADRTFQQLNTIEEDKNETQTSNYMESASERENSKILSSNNLRNSSNVVGLEFDEEPTKKDQQKHSPDVAMNRMLTRGEARMNSASQVVTPPEIDKIEANVELDLNDDRNNNIGRLTGRHKSLKENMISQSMKEASIDRFANEIDGDIQNQKPNLTPQIAIQDKKLDLDSSKDYSSFQELV